MSTDHTDSQVSPINQDEQPQAGNGACLGLAILVLIVVLLLFFVAYLAVDRYSYQSVRFPAGSAFPELIVSNRWGMKKTTYPLRPTDMGDGVTRWMYETSDKSMINVSHDIVFSSPFIIKIPFLSE